MSLVVVLLIAAAAAGLAAYTYLVLERLGRRGALPLACRAVAWAALGVLLVNVSCPRAPVMLRPLVLLDGSLSMAAGGVAWADARALATRLGDVRIFGDDRNPADTTPSRGRSLLTPALAAASASERPVIVVTDGEIEDAPDLPADLLARAGVRLLARPPRRDIAVVSIEGPARITAGDSLRLDIGVRGFGVAAADSVTLEVTTGERRLARRRVSAADGRPVPVAVPTAGLAAGDHLLRVALVAANDAEPRTDSRVHLVTVATTPGIVVLASPGDWDGRFLYRAIRDVAALPVRGYVRVEGDRWRSMRDLAVVPLAEVRAAAAQADLLVLKGAAGAFATGSRARGLWFWPSGEGGETLLTGDWYVSPGSSSPVAGAFLGQPVDSFAPATRITPVQPAPGDWVALTAQENRRGAERPIVVGHDGGRVRRVTVAADGLWRWAFRGGASEQSYRAWTAATVSWLLAGADSARGSARPMRAVVQNGRPLTFEWVAGGNPRNLPVLLTGSGHTRTDTLRFDGSGRAVAWLPVGEYRYRLDDGGSGTVAVEEYSDEWLPRPVTLTAHEARPIRAPTRSSARDWIWLFGLAVLALSAEWLARRRLGLR